MHISVTDYIRLCSAGRIYRDLVGSAYYVAPEVLKWKYGKEIDVWSAGVMLYILLSGFPPFWAGGLHNHKFKNISCHGLQTLCSSLHVSETEKGIFDAILEGKLSFEEAPWPSISDSAKDLIKKMLTKDPKKRITAAEALGQDRLNHHIPFCLKFYY